MRARKSGLSIPVIRDRVVPGALKVILERPSKLISMQGRMEIADRDR